MYQVICSNIYEKINQLKVNNLDKYESKEEKLYDINKMKEISSLIDQHKQLKNDIDKMNDKDDINYKDILEIRMMRIMMKNKKN